VCETYELIRASCPTHSARFRPVRVTHPNNETSRATISDFAYWEWGVAFTT
jgi:hypothetical protein